MCAYTNLYFNIANIQKKDDKEKKRHEFLFKNAEKIDKHQESQIC